MSSYDKTSNEDIDCECGKLCNETDGLRILEQFRQLYENRIGEIDRISSMTELERLSMKLGIMTEWVDDLREQNLMLVHTVEDLERAAASRVKSLEEKLQQSNYAVSKNIFEYTNSKEDLNNISSCISVLEKDKEEMIEINKNLESNVENLLTLIKRHCETGEWDCSGLVFHGFDLEDTLASSCSRCQQESGNYQSFLCAQQLKFLQNSDYLQKCLSPDIRNVLTPPDSINSSILPWTENCDNASVGKNSETERLHQFPQKSHAENETLVHENNQLQEKIKGLEVKLAELQKESSESKEILAIEVAEKHDRIMDLKKKLELLESQCREQHQYIKLQEEKIIQMRRDPEKVKQYQTLFLLKAFRENCRVKNSKEIDRIIVEVANNLSPSLKDRNVGRKYAS